MDEYIGTYGGRGPGGHTLVTLDGNQVVLEPAVILDSRLANVPPGARIKVQKTGAKVPSRTGRKVDEYLVFVAKGSLTAVRRAVVALLGFETSEEPPPAPSTPAALPPVDREALRRELLAEAERLQPEERDRQREQQVGWLRQEAARLGYRLVPLKAPAR